MCLTHTRSPVRAPPRSPQSNTNETSSNNEIDMETEFCQQIQQTEPTVEDPIKQRKPKTDHGILVELVANNCKTVPQYEWHHLNHDTQYKLMNLGPLSWLIHLGMPSTWKSTSAPGRIFFRAVDGLWDTPLSHIFLFPHIPSFLDYSTTHYCTGLSLISQFWLKPGYFR